MGAPRSPEALPASETQLRRPSLGLPPGEVLAELRASNPKPVGMTRKAVVLSVVSPQLASPRAPGSLCRLGGV